MSSSDVMIKSAIRQASRDLGMYIIAGALVIAVFTPLVGLTTVWVYGKYQVNAIKQAMEERAAK